MAVLYMISYDLLKPGKDYKDLWAALYALGAERGLASQWFLRRTGTSPINLANHLVQFMDANDRILVNELPSNYAYRNLMAVPKAA